MPLTTQLSLPEPEMEILRDFIAQRFDQLAEAGNIILHLEENKGDTSVYLQSLFRIFHTLKGNAGFFELSTISSLAHKAETLLDVFRRHETANFDSEVSECLLKAVDRLESLLKFVQLGIQNAKLSDDLMIAEFEEMDTADILNWLDAEISRATGDASKDSPQPPIPSSTVAPTTSAPPGSAELRRQLTALEKELKTTPVKDMQPAVFEQWTGQLQVAVTLNKESGNQKIKGQLESALNLVEFLHNAWPDEDDVASFVNEILKLVQDCSGQLAPSQPETAVAAPAADLHQAQDRREDHPASPDLSPKTPQETFLKISQAQLNDLMNMVGELLVSRHVLEYLSRDISNDSGRPDLAEKVKKVSQNISQISGTLQAAIIAVRMTPISTIFAKFPRLVRDLSRRLEKQIRLGIIGEETKLDKSIIEALSDPLLHLIRNSADHGLESPEERVAAGKSEVGAIDLRAYNEGQSVIIEVSDDGRGIDAERVKKQALHLGLLGPAEAAQLKEEEIYNLIFHSGLTTTETLSQVSGRGVGMDVVHKEITAAGGSIDIQSSRGKGATIRLRLPLTVAVSRGLEIAAAGERFYFPMEYVSEAVKVDPAAIHQHKGSSFLDYRGRVIQVFDLARLLGIAAPLSEDGEVKSLLILNLGGSLCAYMVDGFFKEDEYVLKPLPRQAGQAPWIRGTMTNPVGRLVLVLDPMALRYNS